MAIVTLEEGKRQLNIGLSDTADDSELTAYIDAATGAAEQYAGTVIDQRSVTDELRLRAATEFVLTSVPVVSLTSVATVDGATTWNVADLHVESRSGLVTVLSGPAVSGLVAVTYTAGWSAVTAPQRYKTGVLIIMQHLWETQRGSSGPVLGGGEEVVIPAGFAVPRRAQELLGSSLPGVA